MFDIITTATTNLFRTFILKKFMTIFFHEIKDGKWEKKLYFMFFIITTSMHITFHSPTINIPVNMIMIYIIAQIYDGEQRKKILASLLIYGVNMTCDIISVYSLSNYIAGGHYNEYSPYITVLLISVCEFIVNKFVTKNYKENGKVYFAPPYWYIFILIPIISIIILYVLLMNNLNNRGILVTVSAGVLYINILIFYLYDVLIDDYLKLEESAYFERQVASYANQLDVLMQSEEKICALNHDMKHHLNELLIMAAKDNKQDIVNYIQNMQMFIENKSEYSASGNKEIDSILNFMLSKAERVLCKVDYKVNIPKEIGIRTFDINVIFGNLLENAITASENSKEKWLFVFIKYDKEMLFINIKNSYDNIIIKQEKKYLTTKEDVVKHGIGLQNVRKVVDRYQGNMEICDDNNIFDVKIMLYALQTR